MVRDNEEWVDLGDLSVACITQPETCGPEGAAISVWLNLQDCPGNSGIISSLRYGTSGFAVYCLGSGSIQLVLDLLVYTCCNKIQCTGVEKRLLIWIYKYTTKDIALILIKERQCQEPFVLRNLISLRNLCISELFCIKEPFLCKGTFLC